MSNKVRKARFLFSRCATMHPLSHAWLQVPRLMLSNSCRVSSSIYLLHLGGLVGCTINFFKWWQVIVIAEALVIVIDAQAELDHAVDTSSKLGGLVQVEARSQEGSVKQQPNQVLHSLVRFVGSCLLLELSHD